MCLDQVCMMPLRLRTQQVTDATWNASQVSAIIGNRLILTLLYVHQLNISVSSDNETVSALSVSLE